MGPNPERTDLGISTTTARGRDTRGGRTANAPDARSQDRTDKIQGSNKHTVLKIVGAVGALIAIEGIGAVTTELLNDKPAMVENIPADLMWPMNLLKHDSMKPPQSSWEKKFPIVLSPDKFTPVTPEAEKLLWQNTKTVDLENHTFTIGFPADKGTIDRSPNLRMNTYFEPTLFAGIDTSKLQQLQQEGIKNVTQLSGYSKGAQIGFNYDATRFQASIIAIGIAGIKQGEFIPAYTNYRVILREKKPSGRSFEGTISVLYGKPLKDAAPYPEKHHPVYEDGTPIESGESILELTTDLQDWDGKNQVLHGQGGQVMYAAIAGGISPTTSELLIFSPVFLRASNGNIAPRQ